MGDEAVSDEREAEWQPAVLLPPKMWCKEIMQSCAPFLEAAVANAGKKVFICHNGTFDRECGCPEYILQQSVAGGSGGSLISQCQISTD